MKSVYAKTFAVGFVVLLFSGSRGTATESKRDEAWDILQANVNENSIEKRVLAVYVLGLLPGDTRALGLAQKASADEKPEVRAAA